MRRWGTGARGGRDGGVRDVLISNEVVGAAKLKRVAALAALLATEPPRLTVCRPKVELPPFSE